MLVDGSVEVAEAPERALMVQAAVDVDVLARVGGMDAEDFEIYLTTVEPLWVPQLRARRVVDTRAMSDLCFADVMVQVGHLAFDTVTHYDPSMLCDLTMPAWRVVVSDPGYGFIQFGKEYLGLHPTKVSQYRTLYQVLVMELGYTRDQIAAAGESNLRLAASYLRKLHRLGQRDEELEAMLFEQAGPRYAEIEAHIMARRDAERAERDESDTINIVLEEVPAQNGRPRWEITAWRNGLPYAVGEVVLNPQNADWKWLDMPWGGVQEAVLSELAQIRVPIE